jgi:hypothetical protein
MNIKALFVFVRFVGNNTVEISTTKNYSKPDYYYFVLPGIFMGNKIIV